MKHMQHHAEEIKPLKMSDECKQIISELCDSGLIPFQILGQFRSDSFTAVIYHDVYNVSAANMASKFKRHENHQNICYAIIYIDECDSICEIGNQTNPFGLWFTTSIAQQIVSKWRLDEILIDFTYKRNKQKLELFTAIGSFVGTGFTLCYFLLQAVTCVVLKTREQSLPFPLENLKEKFRTLKPAFFFSDKETSQIKVIRNVFSLNASLCLWHMKKKNRKREAYRIAKKEKHLH